MADQVVVESRPCRYCQRVVQATMNGPYAKGAARVYARSNLERHEQACGRKARGELVVRQEVPLEQFRSPLEDP